MMDPPAPAAHPTVDQRTTKEVTEFKAFELRVTQPKGARRAPDGRPPRQVHLINELFGFELQQDYKEGPYYKDGRYTRDSVRASLCLSVGLCARAHACASASMSAASSARMSL